jgi:transposase-like protein
MKTNARLVVVAIDLYFKGLSYRKISEHLKDIYGVDMTHVAVFNWVRKYLALIRRYISRTAPKVGNKWHCDEMQYRTAGNRDYIWNMMDAKTRFLLACRLTRRRREKEAKDVMMEATRVASKKPHSYVTDGLASYDEVAQDLRAEGEKVQHITRAGQNNAVERLNQTLRERSKTMRLNRRKSIANFAARYQIYYNYLRKHSALGRTPAKAAGIKCKNSWYGLIRDAKNHRHYSSRPLGPTLASKNQHHARIGLSRETRFSTDLARRRRPKEM